MSISPSNSSPKIVKMSSFNCSDHFLEKLWIWALFDTRHSYDITHADKCFKISEFQHRQRINPLPSPKLTKLSSFNFCTIPLKRCGIGSYLTPNIHNGVKFSIFPKLGFPRFDITQPLLKLVFFLVIGLLPKASLVFTIH